MNKETQMILKISIAIIGGIVAFIFKVDIRLCFLIGGVLYFLASFIPVKKKRNDKNTYDLASRKIPSNSNAQTTNKETIKQVVVEKSEIQNKKQQKSEDVPLYNKSHPAVAEISEAEKIASEVIKSEVYGTSKTINLNSGDYLRIKTILDKAIKKYPEDADLFYARASLHYLALQGEDGKNDRDKCLKLNPNHFDALMNQKHFNTWDTVFHLPGWDETQKKLPDLMQQHLKMDHMVQVIRDHLRPAVAVVVPAEKINMAGCTKLRWELKWVKTPHGNIAAHYLFFNNGKFAEFFIPPIENGEPNINSNYWLLRRLANEEFCFITICKGSQVVWNERFMFPPSLIKSLLQMGADLSKSKPDTSLSASQMAANWYMQNSDESSLKY